MITKTKNLLYSAGVASLFIFSPVIASSNYNPADIYTMFAYLDANKAQSPEVEEVVSVTPSVAELTIGESAPVVIPAPVVPVAIEQAPLDAPIPSAAPIGQPPKDKEPDNKSQTPATEAQDLEKKVGELLQAARTFREQIVIMSDKGDQENELTLIRFIKNKTDIITNENLLAIDSVARNANIEARKAQKASFIKRINWICGCKGEPHDAIQELQNLLQKAQEYESLVATHGEGVHEVLRNILKKDGPDDLQYVVDFKELYMVSAGLQAPAK
jgi:hypothetical protein